MIADTCGQLAAFAKGQAAMLAGEPSVAGQQWQPTITSVQKLTPPAEECSSPVHDNYELRRAASEGSSDRSSSENKAPSSSLSAYSEDFVPKARLPSKAPSMEDTSSRRSSPDSGYSTEQRSSSSGSIANTAAHVASGSLQLTIGLLQMSKNEARMQQLKAAFIAKKMQSQAEQASTPTHKNKAPPISKAPATAPTKSQGGISSTNGPPRGTPTGPKAGGLQSSIHAGQKLPYESQQPPRGPGGMGRGGWQRGFGGGRGGRVCPRVLEAGIG